MNAIVRDDIISLDSFVQARFKYEKYLQLIKGAGNYCFLDQFKRYFENGDYIARCMEELNLIKTENLNNNYKYIYLTDTAMKYLVLKDDERDFSDVSKKQISVIKVNKYPSEKVLMSSAMKFEFMAAGKNQLLIKEKLIERLKQDFYSQFEIVNPEEKIKGLQEKLGIIKQEFQKQKEFTERLIQVFKDIQGIELMKSSSDLQKVITQKDLMLKTLEEEYKSLGMLAKGRKNEILEEVQILKLDIGTLKSNSNIKRRLEEQIEKAKEPLIKLNDQYNTIKKQIEDLNKDQEKNKDVDAKFEKLKTKIINLYDKSKIIVYFNKNELNFLILDTGTIKTAYGYLKIINELSTLDYKFDAIKVIIISYSKKRAENLNEEFELTQKERSKALEVMEAYENNANVSRSERNRWQYTPPEHYTSSENIYYNTPKIQTSIISKTHCMDIYKKNISSSENYIKKKDKKTIEELKQRLNSSDLI